MQCYEEEGSVVLLCNKKVSRPLVAFGRISFVLLISVSLVPLSHAVA
jgi:hypothetical protein